MLGTEDRVTERHEHSSQVRPVINLGIPWECNTGGLAKALFQTLYLMLEVLKYFESVLGNVAMELPVPTI